MIKWIRNLLVTVDNRSLERDSEYIEVPIVIGVEPKVEEPEPERELVVGEPIISFVKAVKDNPNRFCFSTSTVTGSVYKVHDRLLNLKFSGIDQSHCEWSNIPYHFWRGRDEKLEWITPDEGEYIFKELKEFVQRRHSERVIRVRNRKHRSGRDKMMALYCKGD